MYFDCEPLAIPDVKLLVPKKSHDKRGFFMETFKQSEFAEYNITSLFKQHNYSNSKKGVLRGLHYQLHPHTEGKLIMCLQGAIFDVAVDLRKQSQTFGQHVSYQLFATSHSLLWIPEGFAHGFYALADETIVLYNSTAEYTKEAERGIIWNDKDLHIKWPHKKPLLSERDTLLPSFEEAEMNF